jgi:hypothetical protein
MTHRESGKSVWSRPFWPYYVLQMSFGESVAGIVESSAAFQGAHIGV